MNLIDLIPYDEILSLIFTLIHILIYFILSVLFQTLQRLWTTMDNYGRHYANDCSWTFLGVLTNAKSCQMLPKTVK